MRSKVLKLSGGLLALDVLLVRATDGYACGCAGEEPPAVYFGLTADEWRGIAFFGGVAAVVLLYTVLLVRVARKSRKPVAAEAASPDAAGERRENM